jgi:hypothetical protein
MTGTGDITAFLTNLGLFLEESYQHTNALTTKMCNG